ncbi:uncharacterized protein LOC129607466 [Condylostylus longicornis]|uniref:uncharacterized protein LOC129607466 n=1 Tax=Condylostylus longicornis TaxID=2530218 RepID=UPI00244DC11C|nr:uncharacterized protein LOC129607466 [Condylostylus longicornis]
MTYQCTYKVAPGTKIFNYVASSSYGSNIFEVDCNNFSRLHTFPILPISSIDFSVFRVKKYLEMLDADCSPWPDNVPKVILKNCSLYLAGPLSILFTHSLSRGHFPQFWKESFIRAVHKNGLKNDVTNYRTIAKLSSIPKLFELMIFDFIYDQCSRRLVPNQHGFVKKRSTTSNLVDAISFYLNATESGFQTDVIYTDLSKAFGLLPHSVILYKLSKFGFPSNLLDWIKSYLLDRVIIGRKSALIKYVRKSKLTRSSSVTPPTSTVLIERNSKSSLN